MASHSSSPTDQPLRVRIHLNLAKPDRAENAVKIQSPKTGAWITVGYATQLLLEACVPVVDLAAQDKIRQGSTRKIPHAFIEGNLRHFVGRLRSKAPSHLLDHARPHLLPLLPAQFLARRDAIQGEQAPINYNPRFAKCFYRQEAAREDITQRFESCPQMVVVGWSFWAKDARFAPMALADRCEAQALAKTKISETLAIRRGLQATQGLVEELVHAPARARSLR